jgi:hypothetical protein
MSKTKQKNDPNQASKTMEATDALEPGKDEFTAYDEAVSKGPPLDSGIRITVGGRRLEDKLEEHNSVSPKLSGGDVDAAWAEAESSGDEAVGGSVATPDQNIVDEIGEAVGLEFQDDEELRAPAEVLDKRDHHRWELDRRSADDAASLNDE